MSEGVEAGAGADGGRRSFGTGALVATGLVALVIGAGGGYAIGHSSGSDSGKTDGIAEGTATEAAKYEPGEPAYEAIYDAGHKQGMAEGQRKGDREGMSEGRKVGFEQGKKVGTEAGEQEGVQNGADAALGGLSGWENGALYIVTTEDGGDIPTVISARHQMVAGNNYKLCKDDPQKLCESPEQ